MANMRFSWLIIAPIFLHFFTQKISAESVITAQVGNYILTFFHSETFYFSLYYQITWLDCYIMLIYEVVYNSFVLQLSYSV